MDVASPARCICLESFREPTVIDADQRTIKKNIYVTEYFSSTFKLLFTLMNIEYQIIPLKMFL